MLGVRSATEYSRKLRLPLAVTAFQPVPGQCFPRAFDFRILPEPETRNGLSLARNDTCAPLRGLCSRPVPSFPRWFCSANPFDPELFRSRSASTPTRANSTPRTRYSRSIPPLLRRTTVSTPLWVFQPSGSKRSTGPAAKSSLRVKLVCLLLPGSISCDLAPDRRSKHRLRPARLSFRKPWN
jgi:hypothetical protein